MSRYIYILTNGRHVLWNGGSACHALNLSLGSSRTHHRATQKTCTLSLVVRYTGREEVHARTRPLTHASVFSRKGG